MAASGLAKVALPPKKHELNCQVECRISCLGSQVSWESSALGNPGVGKCSVSGVGLTNDGRSVCQQATSLRAALPTVIKMLAIDEPGISRYTSCCWQLSSLEICLQNPATLSDSFLNCHTKVRHTKPADHLEVHTQCNVDEPGQHSSTNGEPAWWYTAYPATSISASARYIFKTKFKNQ